MQDPIKLIAETSNIDYEKLKREPIEPWQAYLGTILFGLLAITFGGPAAYSALVFKVYGQPLYLTLGVAGLLLILGGVAFYLRKYTPLVAVLQVASATATGVIAFFTSQNLSQMVLVLVVAAIAIANGLEKLLKNPGEPSPQK